MSDPVLPYTEPLPVSLVGSCVKAGEIVRSYDVLDTAPEAAFDDLACLAATLCHVPIAFITFVDADRQWFKSRVGMDVQQAPLDAGFCPFVVASGEPLIISDTLADPLYATNPVVINAPYIRFYAGVPLLTPEGDAVGTLCVLDSVPRELAQEQRTALEALARQVMALLELRRTNRTLQRQLEENGLQPDAPDRDRSALRETEQHLRALVNNFPNGAVVLFNSDLRFTIAGGKGLMEAGLSPAALEGKSVWDVFDPEVAAVNAPMMRAALDGTETTTDIAFADRVYEVSVLPIRNDEGAVVAGMTLSQDITVRKQVEQKQQQQADAVRNQQQWLESVLNLLPVPLLFLEPQTARVLFANKAANVMAGGTFPLDIPAEAYEQVYTVMDATGQRIPNAQIPGVRVSRGERIEAAELIWQTPSGPRALLLSGDTLPALYGHEAVAVVVFQDITLLQQAQNALRDARARLEAALLAGEIATWVWDIPNNSVVADDNLARLFSISAESALGTPVERYGRAIHPEDQAHVEAAIEAAIRDGNHYEAEFRVMQPDGSARWVVARGRVERDAAGRPLRMPGVVLDITERMKRSQEIEVLNMRLKRSIQETHHRVKNNLQIISALAELQSAENAETVPISAIKRIGQHTRSLAAIHDLLTQEAKADAHTDTLSIRDALDRLLPLLQVTAIGRQIRYHADEFRLPVREGASLALLVSELVSNAVKHGRSMIEVNLTTRGTLACLTVRDDGDGFPAGFDWHEAANTGLDLIDSTGRYDLRGEIVYENHPDGGGLVTVTFPLPDVPL